MILLFDREYAVGSMLVKNGVLTLADAARQADMSEPELAALLSHGI